ncbi:MAG: hypothetical protein KIT33_09505 [Candidatus Kapabacteria bacterium]|nr:hypothetical protein [Ignavibacteriota bacterium]MCW5885193.1 hypothetical protein [Candidatus Kapabacteria bacterium]
MKSLFIAVLFLFILVGCGESGTKPNNSNNVILPLAVGNSWQFVYYSTHDLYNDTIKHDRFKTNYVTETITLEGETWYNFASDGKNTDLIFTNRSDGLYGIFKNRDDHAEIPYHLDSARLGYKYPVILHESYPNDTNGLYIASTNIKIKTDAGTFNCIKYVPSNYKNVEHYGTYMCPGIGFIRAVGITHIQQTESGPDTTWTVQELVSYTIH